MGVFIILVILALLGVVFFLSYLSYRTSNFPVFRNMTGGRKKRAWLICFLIYLAETFHWERNSFLEFKESFLKEQSEIQKCFDKVEWEAEWIDNRYSWDGIYKWTEKFCYDRFSDRSEHTKTTYKLGLDAEKYLESGHCDEDEKYLYEQAIKERSKYSDYNWDELCERMYPADFKFEDWTEEELNDIVPEAWE